MRRELKSSRRKSLAKTFSWRIIATFVTVFVVYVFTGQVALSIGVGLAEFVTKIVLYYLHERAWEHGRWSKLGWRKLRGDGTQQAAFEETHVKTY